MSDDINTLSRALGRVEGKLDAVLAEFRGAIATHNVLLKDHDLRITALEDVNTERRGMIKSAKALWVGLAALAGAVSSFVLTLVAKMWGLQ